MYSRPPTRVLEHPDTTPTVALVAWALWSHAGKGRALVWPSRAALAALTRLSEASIKRGLSTLRRMGAIEDTGSRKGRGVVVYRLSEGAHTEPGHMEPGHTEPPGGSQGAGRGLTQTPEGAHREPRNHQGTTREPQGNDRAANADPPPFRLALSNEEVESGSRVEARACLVWLAEQRTKIRKAHGMRTRATGVAETHVAKFARVLDHLAALDGRTVPEAGKRWRALVTRYDLEPASQDRAKVRYLRPGSGSNVATIQGVELRVSWADRDEGPRAFDANLAEERLDAAREAAERERAERAARDAQREREAQAAASNGERVSRAAKRVGDLF